MSSWRSRVAQGENLAPAMFKTLAWRRDIVTSDADRCRVNGARERLVGAEVANHISSLDDLRWVASIRIEGTFLPVFAAVLSIFVEDALAVVWVGDLSEIFPIRIDDHSAI